MFFFLVNYKWFLQNFPFFFISTEFQITTLIFIKYVNFNFNSFKIFFSFIKKNKAFFSL